MLASKLLTLIKLLYGEILLLYDFAYLILYLETFLKFRYNYATPLDIKELTYKG